LSTTVNEAVSCFEDYTCTVSTKVAFISCWAL